jgi:Cu-processing system permease protein
MTPSGPSIVWLCARQELRLSVRSRWTQTFAVVFAGLALAVASSGYVLSGGQGMQDFARTSASLVELVLLLVPLTSLMFGVMAFASDPGGVELLFSQPVPRHTILAGKMAGVFLALISAQAVGFGAAGLVMFARMGQDGLGSFLGVVAGAVTLTAVFLSLAAAIAAGQTSARRTRNMAVALVIWFIAVVLFDVAALGVASLLPSGPASRVLMVGAIFNPVDAVRTGTLLAVEGTTAFGAASLAFLRFTHGAAGAALWLGASTVGWILAPLAVAVGRLARADIG